MKKKEIIGILATILVVFACYISYCRFGAAIIGLAITAIVLPTVIFFVKRRFSWLSMALAVVIDLAIYWPEFSYYESRGIFICATFVQLVIMAIIILALNLVVAKRET